LRFLRYGVPDSPLSGRIAVNIAKLPELLTKTDGT
jgi:hypothetical protein